MIFHKILLKYNILQTVRYQQHQGQIVKPMTGIEIKFKKYVDLSDE